MDPQHESDLAEHEELCREFYRPNVAWPNRKRLMLLSLKHDGQRMEVERWTNQQELAGYSTALDGSGFSKRFVCDLRVGEELIIDKKLWELTAIRAASEPTKKIEG
jgi:hypothetical protein